MIKSILATVLLLCALPGWLSGQAEKPVAPSNPAQANTAPSNAVQPTTTSTVIHVPVYLVDVPLTVTDKKGRLVIMMTKDDFNLFEDGKPQTIEYFSRETDLAMRIGLLIDTSNSIRDRLRFEQEAAIDFLTDTIRKGKDLAFVLAFDVEPQMVQDYTDNVEKLAAAVRSMQARCYQSL